MRLSLMMMSVMVLMIMSVIVVVPVAPAQDEGCNSARFIGGFPYEYYASTTDQPYSYFSCMTHSAQQSSKGYWFTFFGTGSMITANLCDESTDFDTVLYLFTNCSVAATNSTTNVTYIASSCVAYSDDECERKSRVSMEVEAGVMYWLFVTGFDVSVGFFKLEVVEETSPDSQQCNLATVIDDGSLYYDAEGDTSLSRSYFSTCRNQTLGGLWYRLKGIGLPMIASTCDDSTNFDTVIEVYGACDEASGLPSDCIAFNDDSCLARSAVVWASLHDRPYYIFVTGYLNARGHFFLSIREAASEVHFTCGISEYISSVPFVATDNTMGVPGSWSPCHNLSMNALWYRVHGNGDTMIASTCSLNNYEFDTVIAVYDSCVNSVAYNCIGSNDDYCGLHSHLAFKTEDDKEYYIMIAGYNNDVRGGNYTFSLSYATNQSNGQCWFAQPIASLPFAVSQDTVGTTTTMACNSPANVTTRMGRWYKYYNAENRSVTLTATTCNTETVANTTIETYSACNSFMCTAPNRQCSTSPAQSVVEWSVPPFNETIIFVSTPNGEFFHLDVYESAENTHSQCESALAITQLPFTIEGQTLTSSLSYSDCDQTIKKGMWFTFVGTGNKVIAHTCSARTDFDTYIGVYNACLKEALPAQNSCVTYNDDYENVHEWFSCGRASYVSFATTEGAIYRIMVTGFSSRTGLFFLSVYEETSPVNYQCSGAVAVPMEAMPYSVVGQTTYCNPSNGSCSPGYRRGMWYVIETRKGHTYDITTCSVDTQFDTEFEFYRSCNGGGQECVQDILMDYSCDPFSHATFTEKASKGVYFLFVTGAQESHGMFRLSINHTAPSSDDDDDDGLSGGAIFGIVLCVLLVVGLIVGGIVLAVLFHKRKIAVYEPLK